MNRRLWVAGFWVALAACTYLALTPSPPDAVAHFSDVLLHGFAFSTLTFLCSVAHFARGYLSPAIWMLVYGVAIELVQGQTEARFAELGDVFVDAVGIGVGLLLVLLFAETAESLTGRVLKQLGMGERDD